MKRTLAIGFVLSVFLSGVSVAQTPEASTSKSERIFDATADATKQIGTALEKSRKENRRTLIIWGTNDSQSCIAFHKSLIGNRDIAKTLQYEYDVVRIDVSQSSKKPELASRFGANTSAESLPFLTVLDAAGKTIASEAGKGFVTEQDSKHEVNHKGLLDFLGQHQAKPIDANAILQKAIAQGATDKKIVFLHFGAPWCGWCHRMEDWMAEPPVAAILGKAFVDLKVDTDRMLGGQELLKKYCEKQGGIPWFALVLPEDGSVVTTSDGPKGNIGFPATDEEIEYFVTMLEATKRLSPQDINALSDSLVANRKAREGKTRKQ
jgi:thioredoxin-related protein